MKQRVILLTVNCVVAWCLTGPNAVADFKAGAARVSISPDVKSFTYHLGGYVSPNRNNHNATGVHDTCFARALALSDGTNKCVVVSTDLCFLPVDVRTAVLEKVANLYASNEVFIAATHSHSAPDPMHLIKANTGPSGALPIFDAKLFDFITDRIADSIKSANAALKPAKCGSGQLQGLKLNRNRRGETITDDEMTAMRVETSTGEPLANVFVYAAHPVYYGAEMLEVSGDWSGAFERQMEAAMPPGGVTLFLNGAEGDASPNGSDEGTNPDKILTYAAKIGAKARELSRSITTSTEVELRTWLQTVALPARTPHPLFLLASASLKSTPDQARELVNRVMPTVVDVSYVRIGKMLLMGVPGEPTAPIGLEAKKLAREKGAGNPAIVALTNGWIGYIVTPEQYKAGKYEPTMSFFGDQIGVRILAGIREGLERGPKP